MAGFNDQAPPVPAATADSVLEGIDLSGTNAIVTGASSGLGIAIAMALAKAGANVTLAVRNIAEGQKVAQNIADQFEIIPPTVAYIDLLSMASVRAFAADFGSRPLNFLINNAGLMGPALSITEDGFESQMAVNYFAPFLLSELLLPNLRAAAPARVITVSSGSHHLSEIRLDDLNYRGRHYDKFEAYGHSKLCANLLAVEYSRRHQDDGVTMNAVTPGGVATNLARHATFDDAVKLGWINEDGSLPLGPLKTIEEGAASPVWVAISKELEGRGGLYIEDCAIAPISDRPRSDCYGATAASLHPGTAHQLWEISLPLIQQAGNTQ